VVALGDGRRPTGLRVGQHVNQAQQTDVDHPTTVAVAKVRP
jgi:hypothetical protein